MRHEIIVFPSSIQIRKMSESEKIIHKCLEMMLAVIDAEYPQTVFHKRVESLREANRSNGLKIPATNGTYHVFNKKQLADSQNIRRSKMMEIIRDYYLPPVSSDEGALCVGYIKNLTARELDFFEINAVMKWNLLRDEQKKAEIEFLVSKGYTLTSRGREFLGRVQKEDRQLQDISARNRSTGNNDNTLKDLSAREGALHGNI